MEIYFFNASHYERYYNCNAYKVEDIALEKRQHQWLGSFFIVLTTIYQVLYIPCLISIGKQMRHKDNHCYKIMFYIGIVDMLTLVVNGWVTGYLGIIGAVFCSYPRFLYIAGDWSLICWCAESTLEVVLALNRCFELWSSEMAKNLFGGKKLWIWLAIPTIYGLAIGIWTKASSFSAIYMSWFFNPHVGYLEDVNGVYENIFHTIHNFFLLVSLLFAYIAFCIILYIRSNGIGHIGQQYNYSQKMILFQVFLISSMNGLAALLYVYMQYFHFSELLILMGQICWMNAHGIPPIIYLTMNKSIRKDCKRMFSKMFGRVSPAPPTSTYAIHHPTPITTAFNNNNNNNNNSLNSKNIFTATR